MFKSGRKMQDYLRHTFSQLVDGFADTKVHVVMGNESCDLDSSVCAVSYAYYLHCKNAGGSTTIKVPMMNIPASHFKLRTETTYFFNRLQIPSETLLFRDQLDLSSLRKDGRLVLTLVDHNALTGSDVILEDCVTSVIDHHVRERPENDKVKVKLDTVGSCSTLVAEELLDDPEFKTDAQVAEMLFGTILVDTINRSPHAGKITPRDEAMLGRLQPLIPHVDGDKLFADIQRAKFDISALSNTEILHKDLKVITGMMGLKIAMPSVTMAMKALLDRAGFEGDIDNFLRSQSADVTVIMTLVNDADNITTRQIAVYSKQKSVREQVAERLTSSTELRLTPQQPPFDNIAVFDQGNVQASRKKVMPLLKL